MQEWRMGEEEMKLRDFIADKPIGFKFRCDDHFNKQFYYVLLCFGKHRVFIRDSNDTECSELLEREEQWQEYTPPKKKIKMYAWMVNNLTATDPDKIIVYTHFSPEEWKCPGHPSSTFRARVPSMDVEVEEL